jgi:hypothetical protein
MFMLSGRIKDDAWEDCPMESESQDVMIMDSRRVYYTKAEGASKEGIGRDEILIVTAEGDLYWVDLEDVQMVAEPITKMFDPSGIPPLPHVQ